MELSAARSTLGPPPSPIPSRTPSPVSIPGSAIKYAWACITENSSKTRDTAIAILCVFGICFLRAKKLGFSSGKATAKALFDTTCQTAIAGTALSILGIGLAKNPTDTFECNPYYGFADRWRADATSYDQKLYVKARNVKEVSVCADNIIASVLTVALLSAVLTAKKPDKLVGRVTYLLTTCALTRYFIYSMRYGKERSRQPHFLESLFCYTVGEDFSPVYDKDFYVPCNDSKKSSCLMRLSCALLNKSAGDLVEPILDSSCEAMPVGRVAWSS